MNKEFLTPIDTGKLWDNNLSYRCLGEFIKIYEKKNFPELEGAQLALLGVEESKGSLHNNGCQMAPNAIRRELYSLSKPGFDIKIVDIGNIKAGNTLQDTYLALSVIIDELLKSNIIPVILGGSHDLTLAQFKGYENLTQSINMVVVDGRVDAGGENDEVDSTNFLNEIFRQSSKKLFNFSLLGFQSYYADPDAIETLNKRYFDCKRLGDLRENLEEIEPLVRNADMLSFDISAIRQSDAPGNENPSPNGFYAEQACQIVRYAGISDKLTSIGFYEVNPEADKDNQTTRLVAQMIWYFIEGYYCRKNDFPLESKKSFTKYLVELKDGAHQIVFWKSENSGRWWIEVPVNKKKLAHLREHLLPCSYSDYQMASKGEIPDRWFKAVEKLS